MGGEQPTTGSAQDDATKTSPAPEPRDPNLGRQRQLTPQVGSRTSSIDTFPLISPKGILAVEPVGTEGKAIVNARYRIPQIRNRARIP